MRKYCLFLLFMMLFSCAGTTGRIMLYNFNEPKIAVELALNSVINQSPIFQVPLKWEDCKNGDAVERIYLYFKDQPAEVYMLGFKYDSSIWRASSVSTLAIVGKYDGTIWKFKQDLNDSEVKRITIRFETEILSKIKYPFYKEP